MPSPTLIYGDVPRELVAIPKTSQQCSPLMPPLAARLKDYVPSCAGSAIIYAPAGTLERRYVLARTLSALVVHAPLIVLGLKDKGGSRIARELESFGCTVKEDSKAHHKIVTTTRPAKLEGIEHALQEGGLQQHPLLESWTHPGIFSWDRLDAGSELLLKHLPHFIGAGADLGCGIGVLAKRALLSTKVTAMTLIDIDRRAIVCAKKNIEDPRASFYWKDATQGEAVAKDLDFIVMNPPFHDAGIEDKALGQHFIMRAAEMLRAGGQLWMVANTHLPYETLLAEKFSEVTAIAESDGYKLFKALK